MNHHPELLSFLNEFCSGPKQHRPFWRITGNKRIVLFLHGIQGSPSQFCWLADGLSEDTDYISLLLPGHGSAISTFRQTGMREWLHAIWTVVDFLLPVYEQIDLVGHSMGCLIWLLAHQKYGKCFHGTLFISCPLVIRPTTRYIRNNMLAVSSRPSVNACAQATREANSISFRNPLALLFSLKPYCNLFQLIHRANQLKKMTISNGYAYLGESDEIVSRKSLTAVESFGFATTCLPHCGHNYFTPEAKKLIQQNFLRMISQSK